MSREILFKAKRIDTGEWVKGYIVIYPSGKCEIHKKCIELPDILAIYEVDPETVCQYTGMTDKNGRKIFEGDIVKRRIFDDIIVGKIVWFDIGFCGFHLKYKNSYYAAGKNEQTGRSDDEVIGNIFDNPELLESEGGVRCVFN